MSNKHGHNKATKGILGWKVKESVTFASAESKTGRVDLNVAEFESLLETKGMRVKVYRTGYCPNVKSIDGADDHEGLEVNPKKSMTFTPSKGDSLIVIS